jgi:phosphate transport system protein
MSQELRRHFHEELKDLELEVINMGMASQAIFEDAIKAIVTNDSSLCDHVIASDDQVDKYYLDIERHILDLFALQTPVASDLRLLTALLHINFHLERIADMAVNIAKIVKLAEGLPHDAKVATHIEEMGGIASRMVAAAMDAFSRRDVELCYQLPRMDDPIDRLNRGMLDQILRMSENKPLLEWGIRMHVVSRQIERVGDHAVDIGEQVAFLVTGDFREFTDASHPEAPGPEL